MAEQRYQNYGNRAKNFDNQKQTEEQKFEQKCKEKFGTDYQRFFLQQLSYDEFVNKIKEFIKDKASNISTSQLRNIFSLVKKENELSSLKRIRPKLAYTYGRAEKNESLKELIFLMDSQIQGLNNQTEVPKLKDFFEAIIAYHKYYGGKD